MRAIPAFVAVLLVVAAVGPSVALTAPNATASGATSTGSVADRGGAVVADTSGAPATDTGNATGAATSQPITTFDNQTTRVLILPPAEIQRNGTADSVSDASTALGFRDQRLDARLETITLNRSIETAESQLDREEIIRTELSRAETRTSALRQQERILFRSHNNDSISSRELLIGLARIDARAQQLVARIDALEIAADDIDQFSIGSDASAAKEDLRAIQGPIRAHVGETLRAERGATTIYVETTDTGVVMSMIDGETYYRTAYLPSVRNPESQDGGLVVDDIRPRMQELYPREADIGRIEATHPGTGDTLRGTIVRLNQSDESDDETIFRVTAYFDRGSKQMYKEEVVRTLRSIRNPQQVTSTREGLQLQVNRTYPGGPMLVSLRDTQTDEVVDGDVTINGFNVGRTGADGRLWVLSRRGTFTVTATYDPDGPRQPTTFIRVTPLVETQNQTETVDIGTSRTAAPFRRPSRV
ncbi:DUF7096 domain-containing protein [Salinirubrum litoreum]|uniref:Uncharacterized protein n=1 Tax=Salinirubrum litoreum TaxID=1126234 RepID=A0ABD5REB8_9EURY|nr:hypothetical protein [Salinirubrum litoreum]